MRYLVSSSPHRFKDNPLEKHFFDAWVKENNRPAALLECLLGKELNSVEVPKEQWKVANRLMQWLGSPVGRYFLLNTVASSPQYTQLLNELISLKQYFDHVQRTTSHKPKQSAIPRSRGLQTTKRKRKVARRRKA